MARSPLSPTRRSGRGLFVRLCWRCLHGGARLTVVVILLALVVLGLGLARLSQGPVTLPALAGAVERLANARLEGRQISIGNAVVALGSRTESPGIGFHDVSVHEPDGTTILSAPTVGVRIAPSDLLLGNIRPTAIRLARPRLAFVRSADGRVRAGLGAGVAVADNAAPDAAGFDELARIIDGFVGDAPPAPQLSALRTIRVEDADVTYEDAVTGRAWRTSGSDIRLWRTRDGARGRMRTRITEAEGEVTAITVEAHRPRGTGRTDVSVEFDGLHGDVLAEQLATGSAPPVVRGRLSGDIGFAVGRRGALMRFEGTVTAREGTVPAVAGRLGRIDRGEVAFAWNPDMRRLRLERIEIDGPGLSARLSGTLTPEGPDPFVPDAAEATLSIESLEVDAPRHFASRLSFDGGGISARIETAPLRIAVEDARLTRGDMALAASGGAMPGEDGWTLDLRTRGEDISVAALKAHWPLGAATNARDWVVENIVSGHVPRVSADLSLGSGTPRLDMKFAYRDVVSRYLGPMPPIRQGSGTGGMTWNSFFMDLESGRVRPGEDLAELALDGSGVRIDGLWGEVTPADITVKATGPTRAALALIDHPPLALVSKLGLDPASVAGGADVTARLRFPLIDDLLIEEIDVAADAILTDTRLTLPLAGRTETVTSDRLSLSATTREMTLSGPATIAGTDLEISWQEIYGEDAASRREIAATGRIGPADLRRMGIDLDAFTGGTADAGLRIEQAGGSTAFILSADLSRAILTETRIGWAKQAGAPGLMRASGQLDGQAVAVRDMTLDAAGLAISGSLRLDPDGGLVRADLTRVILDDRAELSATISADAEGGHRAHLDGPWLDLSGLDTDTGRTAQEGEAEETTPMTVTAEIDRLRLSPKVLLSPASAKATRDTAGNLTVDLSATAGPDAGFDATYREAPGSPPTVDLTAPNAGALLRGLGFFEGARGGRLTLNATLDPRPGVDAEGTARIRDTTVAGAGTFGTILDRGGVEEAAKAVQQGGLRFRSVTVPFTYRNAVIGIDNAIARSPMLAVKLDGTVNEETEALDLSGVISPAYALTGALDEVPVLSQLLSGGEGEGILAMTFTVTGSLDEPAFAVNPLSLLTPGFLRNLFEGGGGQPSERFLEQLEPGR